MRLSPLFSIFTTLSCCTIFALPENENIIVGQCLIEKNGQELTVDISDRAIIEWDRFSIEPGEKMGFRFTDSHGAVLNRVIGSDLTQIHGQIFSNGNVYLINPHGIFIGKEGIINTGSFLASTLQCSNEAFLEQRELLFGESQGHSIQNEGKIDCDGHVVFLSEQISNAGWIGTPHGQILFGAGKEIVYFPEDNPSIQIMLGPSLEKDVEMIGILQTGELHGLNIDLLADGNLYGYAVKNEGLIEATGVKNVEGHIHLVAEKGVVHHSGLSKADKIHVLGEHIRIVSPSHLDASRAEGGGEILIGGDYQGNNPDCLNANTTLIEEGTLITASALEKGNGGRVIIWSDGITGHYGTVDVLGGPKGGDGGFVEISGKGSLDFVGLVNAQAPLGKTGELLLDPANITIAAADANIVFAACPTGTYNVTANNATINAALLVTNLGSCSITISTAAAGTQAGTITISNPIAWVSNNSLTLNANSSITVSANVTNTSNLANLTFNCGQTAANSLLSIANGVTVSLTGSGVGPTGTLTLASTSAGSDITISGTVSATDKTLSITLADVFNLAATGSITFNSPGKTFTYTGTNASTFNGPVTITNGNASLTSSAGTFSINSPIANNGTGTLLLGPGTSLTTTAPGTITTAASAGNLTLNAGTTATFGGAITHNATTANFSSTCGTSAIFNGNVLARPNGSTGTTNITAATTAVGTVTIGAGTTFTHSSPDDINLTANVVAGSDVVVNGILNVNNANLTITAVDDFTLAASPAAINYNAASKTYMMDLTSAAGSAATFNGPVTITNGNIDWMTAGGTISINDQLTINGTGTVTLLAAGTITTGVLSNVMHNSPGDLNFTTSLAGTDINVNGLFAIANSNATFFPSDDFTLAATGSMTFSSPLPKTLAFMPGPTTTHAFNGPLNVTGGNLMVDAIDDISIAATTGSITFNSLGGTATFIASGGADPDFTLNGTLSVINGTLSIMTVDDILLNAGSTFTHTASTTTTFLATDSIVFSGSATISNGPFNMTATNGNITFGATGSTNYTSSSPWTMNAPNGDVAINGNVSLVTAASWTIGAGDDFFVNATVTNTSTGDFLVNCGGDCNIGFNTNTVPARFGTAGGHTQMTIGSDFLIISSETTPLATSFLGFSSAGQLGPITLAIGGSLFIEANRAQDAGIESPGTFTMTAGNTLALVTDPLPAQLGRAYIQCNRAGVITANNVHLTGFVGGGQAFIEGLTLPLTVISNTNVSLGANTFMRNTGPSKLVIVVDQQAPLPPAIGNGQFNLAGTAFLSTNGGDLSIYTADPAQNDVDGLINGATLEEGNQVFGVYYSLSGEDPPPFTIFYKTGEQEIPFAQLNLANYAVAEMLQETFDRQMGFAWYAPYWILNKVDSSLRIQAPFYRKPFEYPLVINNSIPR